MNPPTVIRPDWKWGTPQGSREFDRRLDRRLTFREILEWLEEAEDLTLRLQTARERRGRNAAGSANGPRDRPPQ